MEKKVQPFDSFAMVLKVLQWAGFYKLIEEPTTKSQRVRHWLHAYVYRPLVVVFVVLYNIQHLYFLTQVLDDMALLYSALKLELAHLNLFCKLITLCLAHLRVDRLQDLMGEPIFAANNKDEEQYLIEHTSWMNRFCKRFYIGYSMAAFLWVMTPIAQRIQDENSVILSYFPFETKTWIGFSIGVFMESGPMLWICFGHVSLDCLVALYYSQAVVQLKIIKHNLEHLVESKTNNRPNQYNDNESINERFLDSVRRYDKVLWYTKEINSIFNFAITFQIFTTNIQICLAIYEMSMTDILSLPFVFLTALYFSLLAQVFFYCYYGNLVQYESISVNDALYLSDWWSLSPRSCRQLLIAMAFWSRPIAPRVMKNLPLTIGTFVSITRMSYSLFTVLKTTN